MMEQIHLVECLKHAILSHLSAYCAFRVLTRPNEHVILPLRRMALAYRINQSPRLRERG